MIDNATIIKVTALLILGFCLWCSYKMSATTVSNVDKIGDDKPSKVLIATRATTNYWIGFAGVLIIISGLFNLINSELFVAFLTADLLSLGIKLTNDFFNTKK